MKLCRPYKEAEPTHITQFFSNKHKAIDLSYTYGTFLVAPETCRVHKIITDKNFDESLEPLVRGYGIVMKSVIGDAEHFYWHCLPIFPVNVGDIVVRGKIVAQLGNSGFVKKGGKVVPIEDRLRPPYPGKHVHWAGILDGVPSNVLEDVDWSIPVPYTWLDKIKAMIIILLKMSKILKGR